MKRVIPILFVGAVVSVFIDCASVKVTVDYDQEASFTDYQTFYFVRPRRKSQRGPGQGPVRNPLFTQEIMREIKPIMESKGYSEAASQQEADLLVVFYAFIQQRRDFIAPSYRVGRWGRVWRTSPGRVVRYREGSLVIDMVDNKKKAMVWQGVGTGVLDRYNPRSNLVESVEKILEKFPPEQ